jgi:hypothetical protein
MKEVLFEHIKEVPPSDYMKFGDGRKTYTGVGQFSNGYGLSVVKHRSSYGGQDGLYEIMLMKNDVPISMDGITFKDDTVKGFLTAADVIEIIETVRELPGTV